MCVTIRGTQNNLGGKNIFTGNQKRKEKCFFGKISFPLQL